MLTYDEFKERMAVVVTDDVRQQLKEFHNVDADTEVENMLKQEYQNYLKEKEGK